MKTNTQKKALHKQLNDLRSKLAEIENAEREAQNQPLLGVCFKGTNNYSMPEKPSDYWPIYSRVLELKGIGFKVFSFQVDKNGELRVEPCRFQMTVYGEPISLKEMKAAWGKATNKISKLADAALTP